MADLCPYCHQAELPSRARETLWTDLAARGLAIGRVYIELSRARDFSIRQFGRALLDADTLPKATGDDRICPYCYRGHVTRRARESVWMDLAAKIVGVVRVYIEAKRGDQVPWIPMARAIVEGSNPEIYLRKRRVPSEESQADQGQERRTYDYDADLPRAETLDDVSDLEADPSVIDQDPAWDQRDEDEDDDYDDELSLNEELSI